MKTDYHKHLAREKVLIVTDQDLIEGTLCYNRGVRLSDALNAQAANRDKPHLALEDACITRIATGQVLARSEFLLVARHQVVAIVPTSEMLPPAEPARVQGGRGAAPPREDVPAVRPSARSEDAAAHLAALRDPSPEVRRSAAEALGRLGPDARAAVGLLIELTEDPVRPVRSEAIQTLGLIGPAAASAVPRLTAALRERDEAVRRVAARALGGIGSAAADAVPGLTEALRDRSDFVRRAAARALGEVGAAAGPACPSLHAAAADPDELVRHWALLALEKIQGARGAAGDERAEPAQAAV